MILLKRYFHYQKKKTFFHNIINNPLEKDIKTVIPRANNLNLNLKFRTYFRFSFFNRIKRLAFKKQIRFFYDWYFSNDNDFKIKIEKGITYYFYKKIISDNYKYYNYHSLLFKRWFLHLDKKQNE